MGRVALVTGGNRGIGLTVAQRLAADGFSVAVTSRSGEAPEGLFAVACDVTDESSVEEAFKKVESELGPVEVLVANAGITRDTLLLRMSEEDFGATLDTNLMGSFRVAKRASRSMLRARWGRLIFMSSVVGLLGSAGQVNYAASKAGLVGLARSIARELGSRGVRANVVAPGYVQTRLTEVIPDEAKELMLRNTPLGRFGDPPDVARAVRFLCSDEASFITGEVLLVDGGLGM